MPKRIAVVEDILGANERLADENRRLLDRAGVVGLNLVASPGAGKTSLIEQTLILLRNRFRIAVIDGDIATSIDADRAEAAGALAVQINTGGECHLDAVMVRKALDVINLDEVDLLIVENVGNLICPANFQIGTHKSVLIASIPEGDDKPHKYPVMYQGVDALVINKVDLLPYIDFNMGFFTEGVEALNPNLISFPLSCKTGDGVNAWIDWVVQLIATRASDKENG